MKLSYIALAFYIFIGGLSISLPTQANDLSQLTIITEDYPPFNYNDNGKPAGPAVDLLLKAAKASKQEISLDQIKLMNWARAYKMAQEGPNVLLFSMTRTKEREHKFKWAGPIAQNRVVVWAKKSSNIKNISNISAPPEKIGVMRDDVGDQLATAAGVPDDMLKRNSKSEGLAKMFISDRVKLMGFGENAAKQILTKLGEDMDNYEVVYVLESNDVYFAFSKDVDNSLISKLQKNIDQLR